MDKPKHTKIKTFEPQQDGTVKITTDSYFEELASSKQEIQKQIKTDKDKFLSDLISAVDVITGQQTRELTLQIVTDNTNKPMRITKTYTLFKENFNKR